jgi:serine/threonine protein kinase
MRRVNSGIEFARKRIPKREVTVLQREVDAIRNLGHKGSHKNIISILNHGELSLGYYYIDMELCDYDLRHFISSDELQFLSKVKRWQANDDLIWHIVEDISCGVAFVHSQDCIHRDLKSDNSMTQSMDKSLS